MKTNLFFVIALTLTLLTSCKKEDIPVIGSVSGMVTEQSGSLQVAGTPLEGIKMYLINLDFKPDLINYSNNLKAIVDSTVTGKDGKYAINAIPKGSYGLTPSAESGNLRFTLAAPSDSARFLVNDKGEQYKINFNAKAPDNGAYHFELYIHNKNKPAGGFVTIRRQAMFFTVIWAFSIVKSLTERNTSENIHLQETWGYYAFLYMFTNNYLIDTYGSNSQYISSYWITWPDISSTPDASWWEIDWTAKTIIRL